MRARIYRPAKNAMQSGKARTKQWLLEYEPESPRTIDPLMGWTSSRDMRQQLQLEFEVSDLTGIAVRAGPPRLGSVLVESAAAATRCKHVLRMATGVPAPGNCR